MSYYLSKYVGTYRLMADIDQSTNDFPRLPDNDQLEQNDVYIKCKQGIKVWHYGRNKLQCYVPSLGRGHNILKKFASDNNINYMDFCEKNILNYEEFYKEIEKLNVIFEIEENDEEVLWKVEDKNLKHIIDYLQPSTSGASISPFSSRNLKINKDYSIDNDQILLYEKISSLVDKDDKLLIHRITMSYLDNIVQKKYKRMDIKKEMKKRQLKAKEFIHSLGLFDDYLSYLEKEVTKNQKKVN